MPEQPSAIDREVEIVNLATDIAAIPPEMWADATDANDEGKALHAVAEAMHAMGWRRGEPEQPSGDGVRVAARFVRDVLVLCDTVLGKRPDRSPKAVAEFVRYMAEPYRQQIDGIGGGHGG